MSNLGIANPRVRLLRNLPGVGEVNSKINFESSAHNKDSVFKSPFFEPLLVEQVSDGEFAAMHLSKRISWVENYIDAISEGQYDEKPSVTWAELETPDSPSIMDNIIPHYKQYDLIQIPEYGENDLSDYNGPIWSNSIMNREPDPNDRRTIEEFLDQIGISLEEDEDDGDDGWVSEEMPNIHWLSQEKVMDGLWWGLESSSFLTLDMPFWVILKRKLPPTSYDHETLLVITIGLTDASNRFEIFLSNNQKPRIIDWGEYEDSPLVQKEFDVDAATIWSDEENQKIAIMTIAGRLVVLVNDTPLIYTRINKQANDRGGALGICHIAPGPIALYGTNIQSSINVSPMTFAQRGAIAIPVPVLAAGQGDGDAPSTWRGVNHQGEPQDSVCDLPTPPSEPMQLFGCDCLSFYGDGGSTSPSGLGFHRVGEINFFKASSQEFPALPSTEFYVMEFIPSDIPWGNNIIKYGGTPFYFRLKGMAYRNDGSEPSGSSGDITNAVLSISETATASDYFHCSKAVDVTCYDPNGEVSSILVNGQTGIELYWGWEVDQVKTFTGVVTSNNITQTAGMEMVNIRAEDYFYILKNTPIINSPFYDGMVAYYALKDMAERARISSIINSFVSANDYFLPAGLSFSKPALRYNSTQSIFDCMIDVVKRFEAFLFFNENGSLVIEKLPGGLFSVYSGGGAEFNSAPDGQVDGIILDEKNAEINYDSTVNVISAMTVDRNTRNAILYVKSARGAENNLLFKKVYLYNQSALGDLESCRQHVNDLAERMFSPILKSRWKTAGLNVGIMPLDFAVVDGHPFRIMSLKRDFNAENNDLTTSYEGEWLGG